MQCESTFWFRLAFTGCFEVNEPMNSVLPSIDRNVDCDYSSAYVILKTSSPDLKGFGMTFTIGRGNDIVRPDSFPCRDNPKTVVLA